MQDSPQNAGDPRFQGDAAHLRHDLPFRDPVSDFLHSLKSSAGRSPQNPFPGMPADISGDARIRLRLTLFNHPSQAMPAVCLDDNVHIPSGTKTGAQADNQGGITEGRAGISLGQDRIDQYIRRQNFPDGAPRVDEDRRLPVLPAALDFFFAGDPPPDQPLDLGSPCENGFAEGDSPAYSQRFRDFRDADPEARADQPQNNARGHFASAFDQDDEILQPLLYQGSAAFPERANRVSTDRAPQAEAAVA